MNEQEAALFYGYSRMAMQPTWPELSETSQATIPHDEFFNLDVPF